MTQNNFRKEPVFGEPLTTNVEEKEIIDSSNTADTHNKPYVSLHSNQAPGHTFTPMMERPEETLEGKVAESVASAKEFAFTPSSESQQSEAVNVEVASAAIHSDAQIERVDSATTQENIAQPTTEGFTTERIIPNAAATAASAAVAATAATLSATDAVKAKIPPKTRRLLLVALLTLVLLVIFFLLKPSTPETVEELQSQQGSSLPIEFRPVDEAEAKRAEEQARAEQEAAAKAQEEQRKAQEQTQQDANTQQVAQNEQTATNQTQTSVEQPVAVKPVENKPAAQVATKPQTQGSVVYQPETPAKPQPKAQPKPERVQPAVKENKVAAKPAQEKAPAKVETAKTTASSTATTSTKTMTVPKGVSLMQVFRDNNLNIADVNAMSKVNNVVSNLKVGERVTVRLDKNNRVVEMSLSSGGKFTRQANGNYTFK